MPGHASAEHGPACVSVACSVGGWYLFHARPVHSGVEMLNNVGRKMLQGRAFHANGLVGGLEPGHDYASADRTVLLPASSGVPTPFPFHNSFFSR